MNLRFWGGWFLAIACVCIFLTMGCEKGSLGVKEATVSGRVVNKDNVAMGVPNVTVRMVSKETISGGGELEQGYNFCSTVTDAEGYFVFERVQPDNVIFEFSAPGYKKVVFPATSDTEEADGTTSEKLDIDSVTISNGAHIDLMNVFMEKVSVALPNTIKVQLDLIDANTKKPVDEKELFKVTFDGVSYTDGNPKSARWWKNTGVEVYGASQIAVAISNESDTVLYNSTTINISGNSDQYVSVEVKPVTYDLVFQFLNVPQYILSSTKNVPLLSFLVEYYENDQGPAQSISITPVTDFNQLAVLEVPTVRKPQQIRIRMQGYEDEVILLSNELDDGEKGTYRIDVDFALEDGHKGDDSPITGSELKGKVGLKDNVIKRNIVINMIGLAEKDRANIVPNFTPEYITWSQSFSTPEGELIGMANNLGQITATLNNCPTYFDMSYTISVFPDNPASSSYLITSGDKTISIGVPEKETDYTKFSIDVSKMDSSSTSN